MNFNNSIARSFATLRAMLKARGEDTASIDRIATEDVLALSGARSVFHVDLESCGHRVVYNMNAKFKLADVRKLLEEGDARVVVVVARDRPVNTGRKGLDDVGKEVQLFELRELQYDVSRHELVPPHEPIRDEAEIEELVRRYRLKNRYHMPLILSTDVMARFLALKHGQLVRITRSSPSAGSYVMYRCCMRA